MTDEAGGPPSTSLATTAQANNDPTEIAVAPVRTPAALPAPAYGAATSVACMKHTFPPSKPGACWQFASPGSELAGPTEG
jgi:hypothetical protein